jgi:hypothetical protein
MYQVVSRSLLTTDCTSDSIESELRSELEKVQQQDDILASSAQPVADGDRIILGKNYAFKIRFEKNSSKDDILRERFSLDALAKHTVHFNVIRYFGCIQFNFSVEPLSVMNLFNHSPYG